jgi:hypothetical protein
MISRAMLGLAATLIAAPLGSAAIAADRLDGGMPAQGYAFHRHHAPAHFGHHRHYRHHGHYGLAHRRLLYRNPAYAGRGWRVHQRSYAQAGSHDAHYGWRVPLFRRAFAPYGADAAAAALTYRASYAYPTAGSYVGGPRYGALYNQPACWCR